MMVKHESNPQQDEEELTEMLESPGSLSKQSSIQMQPDEPYSIV